MIKSVAEKRKGMIEIDGHEFIIERKLKRTAKKTGEWTVVSKVNYYEILPDGEEKMLLFNFPTKIQ